MVVRSKLIYSIEEERLDSAKRKFSFVFCFVFSGVGIYYSGVMVVILVARSDGCNRCRVGIIRVCASSVRFF